MHKVLSPVPGIQHMIDIYYSQNITIIARGSMKSIVKAKETEKHHAATQWAL